MDHNTRPTRCQQIIDLIDECLAEYDASARRAAVSVQEGSRR